MIVNFNPFEKLLLRLNIIPHPLFDSLSNVVSGRALQIAVKIGIFDCLSDEKAMSINEIAKSCDAQVKGISVLCDCLESMLYLTKDSNNNFFLSKRGRRFFSKKSLYSMSKLVLFDAEFAFKRLIDLEKNIRQGYSSSVDPREISDNEWSIFNEAMLDLAKRSASELSKKVKLKPEATNLIDLGGMHGQYAIEFCKQNPKLTAEVLDLAPTEQFANTTIGSQSEDIKKRVSFKTFDFLTDDFERKNDVAIAVNVAHTLTETDNQTLTKKVYDNLNPNGIFIVADQIKHLSKGSALTNFFVNSLGVMLFNHTGGATYTFEEIKQWMVNSGFRKVLLKKMNTPGFGVVIAEK